MPPANASTAAGSTRKSRFLTGGVYPDTMRRAKRARAAVNSTLTIDVLVALAVVVVTGRLLGKALGWIGQPPVIGEVLAGILLGPSLLGHASPSFEARLFPEAVKPALAVVAQIGVILYMLDRKSVV